MKIKRLITVLLTACFNHTADQRGKGGRDYPNLDEKITVKSYSGEKYKAGEAPNEEECYALSSKGRNLDQTIVMPSDKVMVLENSGNQNYTDLRAVLEEDSCTNDIDLVLSSKQLRAQSTVSLKINFADKKTEPCLNRTAILIKEGNDVVKRIPFSYDNSRIPG